MGAGERDVLPAHGAARANRSGGALEPSPDLPAIVVLGEGRVAPPLQRDAGLQPGERAARERPVELDPGTLPAAPRQRKRDAAPRTRRSDHREARAIGDAVAVLGVQHRQQQQRAETATPDDWAAGRRQTHGTLVDDDDDRDLGRVLDRPEALQDLDVIELFRRAKAGRDVLNGRGPERVADADAGQREHLVGRHDQVSVHLNVDDALGALRRGGALPRHDSREAERRQTAYRPSPPTLKRELVSACR